MWRTFLHNHAADIAAMDLFVVPTIDFDLLYAFISVRLDRRDLVWINVTTNPTAEWIARQLGISLGRSSALPHPRSRSNLWCYSEKQRKEYADFFQAFEDAVFAPVGEYLNSRMAGIGLAPLRKNLYDAMVELPDVYLQLTVLRFELPRRQPTPSVHFVGPLPITPGQAPIPPWAQDLDGSRKVVLVTQGTLTNDDFGELVLPTLEALANEPDIIVVVTTGGRPVETLGGPLPDNVRVAQYLPFEWVLSKIDAFVTNGGYGSVNQALSFGVPIVTAGTAADRGDVSARVAWSGVGVNLATNAPTAAALRPAVRSVLDNPKFRAQAALYAEEVRGIDTRSEILRILQRQVPASRDDELQCRKAAARR
jgi:hypothetical protein